MKKPSPPPYSSASHGPFQHPAAVEADALLDHLTDRVNEQHVLREDYPPGVQAILDRETERIRNMLEYTLAVDYQGYTNASMSAADLEHFIYIGNALRQLRSTVVRHSERPSPEVRPNPEERQVLAAYFWKYLFEPCKSLSVPLDMVWRSIFALNQYTDSNGFYKGSVFGLLQQEGVGSLAVKLYRDRRVLIPLIFTDYTSRNRMLHRVDTIEEMYFHSINGLESSTLPNVNVPGAQGVQRSDSVIYDANERAIAYASTRKAAIARACKELSAKHWTRAVDRCVDGVLARFKLVKEGKRKPDYPKATWRGEAQMPFLMNQRSDAAIPAGWWRLCSVHIPDYCEFRDQVLMNDC